MTHECVTWQDTVVVGGCCMLLTQAPIVPASLFSHKCSVLQRVAVCCVVAFSSHIALPTQVQGDAVCCSVL